MAAEPQLTAVDLEAAAAIAGPDEPPVDSWTPVNLNDLPEHPPIQPDLAATGLIYPGKRHVFSGPPESAKTLAAYCILIQVVRNGATAGLLDFEMGGYDARQRLRELGATPPEISRILYLEPDERATPQRIAQLAAHKPHLIVIDAAAGAYALEGLDDNKRLEVERFANLYIGIFWRNGIATILIDHVVKNADERGRYQIGSERKLGSSDVHFGFDTIKAVSRGSNGHYKLIVHKDRGGYHPRGHLCDLKLDSEPDTHQIEWSFTDPAPDTDDEGRFRPTTLMQKVSANLELRTEPATRNNVFDDLGGKKKYVLDAINALVREGFVTETDGTNRSKQLTSTRRYREDDPTCNPETRVVPTVPEWFSSTSGSRSTQVVPSGSGTTSWRGGEVVPPPLGEPPPTTTPQTTPKLNGWFPNDDTYTDSPDLSYYDTLEHGKDADA